MPTRRRKRYADNDKAGQQHPLYQSGDVRPLPGLYWGYRTTMPVQYVTILD